MTQPIEQLRQLALLYLRESSDPNETTLAVQRQRKDGLALAADRDLDVPAHLIFTDNDKSAKGEVVRDGFEGLKHAVEVLGVRVIICYKLTRLSRNATDTAWLDKMGERYGLVIIETSGTTYKLDDSSNSLNFGMLMVVSAHQSKVTSELVRRKNQATREAGGRTGGRRIFGYTLDMKIIDHEAEAVRWAFQATLDGESLRTITDEWIRRGLRTPQGKRAGRNSQRQGNGGEWRSTSVSKVLRRKAYINILTYGDVDLGPGSWDSIIDEPTFWAVQTKINDPDRLTNKNLPQQRLLTGIAICGCSGCGAPVNGSGTSHRTGPVYSCSTRKHFRRRADLVDEFVIKNILARLAEPDAHDHITATDDDYVAGLHVERRRLQGLKSNLADALGDGTLDLADHKRQVTKIKAKMTEVDDALARCATSKVTSQMAELIDAEDMRAHWKSLTQDVQRLIISTLVDVRVMPVGKGIKRFDPDSVTVEFRSL